jgi:hypothetical protein
LAPWRFRAVVVSVAGPAIKAFSLVLKGRVSAVLPMTLAMGEYQDPDGCYMPSILY